MTEQKPGYKILDTKTIDPEKQIALVEWPRATFTEYSTHAIYPQGSEGLHHGNYYNSLKDAQKNFRQRR